MRDAIIAGAPVTLSFDNATLADGIAVRQSRLSQTLKLVQQWVLLIVTVDEEEIAQADPAFFWSGEKTVAEGAGSGGARCLHDPQGRAWRAGR